MLDNDISMVDCITKTLSNQNEAVLKSRSMLFVHSYIPHNVYEWPFTW